MKRLLVATAALCLLVGSAAQAEDKHPAGQGGGNPHPSPTSGVHAGGGAPHGGVPAGSGGAHFPGQHAPVGQPSVPAHAGPMPYVPQGHNDRPRADTGTAIAGAIAGALAGHAETHHGRSNFGAPGFTPQGGDRPRYDQRYFPRQVHANRRFDWRGGHDWHDQPGFRYRRWAYGEFLPFGWFAVQFWIDNYFDYDLPVPPYGYEWVRFGPDALLVDTYTGEVMETVYGVFLTLACSDRAERSDRNTDLLTHRTKHEQIARRRAVEVRVGVSRRQFGSAILSARTIV